MGTYIKLFRVKHYIKNGLVFLPLFFGGSTRNVNLMIISVLGFIVFSLSSSIVYIFNDIADVEKDRLHPIKKNRPLAKGLISVQQSYRFIILLAVAIIILIFYAHLNLWSQAILALYILSNLAYSLKLKHYPIIDVSIIALGFVLRVLFGGSIINIPISDWLILTIIAFSFYMAFGKRRNEIKKNGSESRSVLSKYSLNFLDKSMYVSETLLLVFYALWSLSNNSIVKNSHLLIWTVPLVIIIVFRYSLILEKDNFGDPADVLFSDKTLLSLSILYSLFLFYIYLV